MVLSKVWAVRIAIANKSKTAFELFGICCALSQATGDSAILLMNACSNIFLRMLYICISVF